VLCNILADHRLAPHIHARWIHIINAGRKVAHKVRNSYKHLNYFIYLNFTFRVRIHVPVKHHTHVKTIHKIKTVHIGVPIKERPKKKKGWEQGWAYSKKSNAYLRPPSTFIFNY
jgi:hypothetical protein